MTDIYCPKVYLFVKNAKNLRKADKFSESDPYVEISFSHGSQKCKTETIMDDCNPQWNEKKSFFLHDHELENARKNNEVLSVTLSVYDWDALSKRDLLGKVTVQLDIQDEELKSAQGKEFEDVPMEKGTLSFNIRTQNF